MNLEPYETITRWIQRQRSKQMLEIIAEELLQDSREEIPYTQDLPAMNALRQVYKEQVEVVRAEE